MRTIYLLFGFLFVILFTNGCTRGGELISDNTNSYRINATAKSDQAGLTGKVSIVGWYYKEMNVLSFTLTWTDLWTNSGKLTNIRFYSGKSGVSGTLIDSIEINSSNASGSINLSLAGHQGLVGTQIDDLIAGNWYFILCTTAYPDGIVRGQLDVSLKDPSVHLSNLVKDIILNEGINSIIIYEDKTQQINFSVLPTYADNREVKWESSDVSILTVDQDGLLTGVNVGKAILRVSALDESNVISILNVEVINPDKISKITLDISNELNLLASDATVLLKTRVEPETALNKTLSFESSNINVATVNANGLVTGIGAGKATITVKATDGTGIQTTCLVAVDPDLQEYDRSTWGVSCSSEKESDGGGKMMILNDSYTTYWHSMWTPNSPLPHWLLIDMKEQKEINKIFVARRQNGSVVTTDTKIIIVSFSTDGTIFTQLRTLDYGDTSNNSLTTGLSRELVFPTQTARYIKLDITESNRAPYANISVLKVHKLK
ncbi:hypothetical protein EZS27_002788 [termite gut metagenome]|uniref:F5/8 type C domain-containing protein n=1 Tax=termite gut metagenome TaxID=433724 RepID=A0A5J4SX41_9ZZZZ